MPFHQVREKTSLFPQFIKGSLLDDHALVEHNDPVAMANRGEAMRNDHTGTAHPIQVLRHLLLTHVIQGTGRLVKEKDGRTIDQGTCDQQPLLLSTTEATTPFADLRVHAHRQRLDIIRYAR